MEMRACGLYVYRFAASHSCNILLVFLHQSMLEEKTFLTMRKARV